MELLFESVIRHVTMLYEDYNQPELCYHNLDHTIAVADHAGAIMNHFRLPFNQQFIIRTAAWFHDTGHLFGGMNGHEKRSIELMEEFLCGNNCDSRFIQQIASCILATKTSAVPISLPEKVLSDANYFHFGTVGFFENDEKLRKETQWRNDEIVYDWDINRIAFLTRHQYHTIYCQDRLNAGKAHNIALLRLRLAQKSN